MPQHCGQPLKRWPVGFIDRAQRSFDALHLVYRDPGSQGLLRGKVLVKRDLSDADLCRKLVHGHAFVAALGQQGICGSKNRLFALLPLALLKFTHRSILYGWFSSVLNT